MRISNWFALVSIARCQELLLDAFTARKSKALAGSQTPFAIFVKKLQESLTWMEAFDMVTVTQGMDGTSPPTNAPACCTLVYSNVLIDTELKESLMRPGGLPLLVTMYN